MALPDAAPSRAPVELRVQADYSQIPVMRAVAETIAVLTDFTLDHVSDIKLAVDEICSVLVKDAAEDAELVCCFERLEESIFVRIDTDTRTDLVPDRGSFGWHVLRTLTDTITVAHEARDGGGFHTTVEFTKAFGSDY
ncbi:anti-sigma factor [Rhodococcus triatomae]